MSMGGVIASVTGDDRAALHGPMQVFGFVVAVGSETRQGSFDLVGTPVPKEGIVAQYAASDQPLF